MKKYQLFIAAAAMLFSLMPSAASAQGTTSPYSKFGYGMLGDNATSTQRAMGGVVYAMPNGRQVNTMNPASYSATDSLTFLFDMGLDLNNMWAKEDDKRAYSLGGGLDYVSIQVPLSKTVGASIGLMPYSSMGYSYTTTLDNGYELRTGKGGLNQLYLGAGWRPFKNFSIGFNLSYLFGTFAYNTVGVLTSNTYFYREMKVRDYNLQFGAQYTVDISRDRHVTLGAVYSPKKYLHGTTMATKYDTEQDAVIDTIGSMNLNKNYNTPHSIGVGLSYGHDNHFLVEADFTYQMWKDTQYPTIQSKDGEYIEEPTQFNNRYRIGVGMEYTPNFRGNYAQRIKFRVGAWYNSDYLTAKGNKLGDYGVGLGFGLPTSSSKTIINFGVEYRHRNSSPVKLITEDYVNVTVGVTFNEMWFWKSKIR